MTRLIVLVAALLGLAACASTEPVRRVAANSATGDTVEAVAGVGATQEQRDQLVCKRVKATGSHRMEKICRYQSDIDQEREETQRMLRDETRNDRPRTSN